MSERPARLRIHGAGAAGLPAWQPWAALAAGSLALNFAWEMLQAPLYEGMVAMPRGRATWLCARASAGDAVITLAAYGSVAAAAGSRAWVAHPRVARVAGYLAVGLAVTVALEYLNVYALGRWAYGPSMPRVLGVGLAPLAQWLVVPLLSLWLARNYVRRRTPHTSIAQETAP
jgi:hypothetical protein